MRDIILLTGLVLTLGCCGPQRTADDPPTGGGGDEGEGERPAEGEGEGEGEGDPNQPAEGEGEGEGEPDGPTADQLAAADRLAEWLAGRFDSSAQARRDPEFLSVHLHVCPIEAPDLGERVLYVEQAMTDSLSRPYRQRLYGVEPIPGDEVRVVSRVMSFGDPAPLVGLCRGRTEWRADEHVIEPRDGCDVVLDWDGEEFSGGTQGKDCTSSLAGAAYATSEVTVSAERVHSWDPGFARNGDQVWGAVAGAYEFLRLDGEEREGPAVGGETCDDAPALADASEELEDEVYAWRIEGTLGASDDYNPYSSSGLLPGCSPVYDARGRDVVFQVRLAPGDLLRVRYVLAPDDRPGGLYLLDDCAEATWPDHDDSGLCGRNEYRSQGYCGVFECEPIEFEFLHPEVLNGVATDPLDYWLVLDEVAGESAESFVLDWAILPGA